jgi:hypothetical protein
LLIARDRIERDRRGIGVVRIAEILHRPVADIGDRHRVRRRRWRIGRAFGHEERAIDP